MVPGGGVADKRREAPPVSMVPGGGVADERRRRRD
jgi:hypothetical protein